MDYSVVLLSDSSLQTLHLFFVLKVEKATRAGE